MQGVVVMSTEVGSGVSDTARGCAKATASAVFALSDRAAQRIEGGARDAKRTLTSALVGLLYFGPALH